MSEWFYLEKGLMNYSLYNLNSAVNMIYHFIYTKLWPKGQITTLHSNVNLHSDVNTQENFEMYVFLER